MTQALAGFNQHGIVLATDSRATRFGAGGRPEFFTVKKLLPLTPHSAILSGGAGVSVSLSLALRREIARHRGLVELEDLADFALPFLSRGYQQHLKRHGPEPEGFRRLYFILAGATPDKPPGYALSLLGSEENEPLKVIPVGQVVVMPRHLGMEVRLFKALQAGAGLQEILDLAKDFLDNMSQTKEEVGPPFYFATITAAGYAEVSP
jgi:hypothetical protein